MEKVEFEKRFLALVNQTDVVITAANVAYHLGTPIEETQEQLISLELNGVLKQDASEDGDPVYLLPNRPAPGTLPAPLDGEKSLAAGGTHLPGVHNPADLPPAPLVGGPGAAPAKGRNVNGFVLNVIVPGLGSLMCGRGNGWGMLGLLLLGFVLIIVLSGWSKLIAAPLMLGAWLWSIAAGLSLLEEREPGPGVPR